MVRPNIHTYIRTYIHAYKHTGLSRKGVIKPRALVLNKKNMPYNQINLLGRILLILHHLCCFQALYGPSYNYQPSYIIGLKENGILEDLM
jgi:hypothetical protein